MDLPLQPGGRGLPPGEEARLQAPNRPIHTPPAGPPQNTSVSKEIYEAMGPQAIRDLIEGLYDLLYKSEIGTMFPEGDAGKADAVDRSTAFFTFLFGGPPVYQQKYGPPMMRARHLRFPIDDHARQVWLGCFHRAIDDAVKRNEFPVEHRDGFEDFLEKFSRWMVNLDRG